MPEKNTEPGPLIAIVGCDGSGKSTVAEQIIITAAEFSPAIAVHLGKQAGNVGRNLAQLPLIGKYIERLIERKVAKVHQSGKKNKTPGVISSLVMYAFVIRRKARFRRMLQLREQGLIIVADRFPQLDVPNAYDGPDLSIDAQGNFIVRWLARREFNAFKWMTANVPDLVIRLNVDVETACARKPDHPRELLQRKIEVTPLFKFNGAPIIEIDSLQPLEQVLLQTKQRVSEFLTERGFTKSIQNSD